MLDKQEQLLLPVMSSTSDEHCSSGNTSLAHHSKCSSSSKDVAKLERKGKGTHGLTIVRRMLANQENWQTKSTKSDLKNQVCKQYTTLQIAESYLKHVEMSTIYGMIYKEAGTKTEKL